MTSCCEQLIEYINSGGHSASIDKCFGCNNRILECEYATVSEFSPGFVSDGESLVFLLVDPNHFDPVTDTVAVAAAEQAFRSDLSLLRLSYITADECSRTKKILERNDESGRSVSRCSVVQCSNFRSMTHNNSRCLAVLDTAFPESPSHASAVSVVSPPLNRQGRAMKRLEITTLFEAGKLYLDEIFPEIV